MEVFRSNIICYDLSGIMLKKNRIIAFDFLKFFAIFLVVWGHSLQYFLSSDYSDEVVFRIIYSFHMPLFMMVSGYFSVSSMSLDIGKFLNKKMVQLLLPVFSWGLILWIWQLVYDCIQTKVLSIHIDCLLQILLCDFWFLKSCFICYFLYYCRRFFKTKILSWTYVSLFLSQFIPYAQMWIMYPCFLLGIELRTKPLFFSHIKENYLKYLILFMIMLCFWGKSFFINGNGLFSVIIGLLKDDFVPLHMWCYNIYRLAIGIIGSVACIGFFCHFPQETNNRLLNLCCEYGRYTLELYVIQVLVIEEVLSKYINFDNLNFYFCNFVAMPLVSLVFLVVCVYVVKSVSKNTFFRFLLFGKANSNYTALSCKNSR